jgi:hypothetical protein
MSRSKHTPGPWKIATDKDGNLIHGVVTNETHIASVGGDYQTDELRQANTRLIAAAPDMLEALERIAHIEANRIGVSTWKDLASESIDIARAAVAKAKGGK